MNEDDTPSVLSSYEYTLDGVGNRTQVVDTNGTTTLEYDAMHQLTGVTYPNDDEQAYTYDAMGNRLTKTENETTIEYNYDAADQMTEADEVGYVYDENGNQTERGTDTFAYDHENRLTDTEIDSVTGSYVYNGDGLRQSRTVDANAVSYVWDVASQLPMMLQDSADNTYVYGLDLISRTDDQDEQEYFLYDGLGSSTGLADDAANVNDTFEYDVFGAIRSHTGSSPNEFTFTGEQNDPTGLEYLRARYYDAATGRFIGRDPLPYLQRYAYAANNPTNLVDPAGLSPDLGALAEAAAQCALENALTYVMGDPNPCADLLGQIKSAIEATISVADQCWESEFCKTVVVSLGVTGCSFLTSGPTGGLGAYGCAAAGTAILSHEDAVECTGGSALSCGDVAFTFALELGFARVGQLGFHAGLHPAHHTFPGLAQKPHLEAVVWLRGASNSNIVLGRQPVTLLPKWWNWWPKITIQ